MPKQQIKSDKLRQPSGIFRRRPCEATGRLVFISGMGRNGRTARSPASATSRPRRARCARTSRPRWRPPAARSPMSAASMSMCATWRTSAPIHKVRREYFRSPPPASTLVEVGKFTHPDYLIEMSAIAVIP